MHDLSRHIKEAIHINQQRLPLYAQLTDNKSVPFSKKLINYEKSILLTSWILDKVGERYQKRGVPFMKYEFVEMSKVKKFSKRFPSNIKYQDPIIPFDKKEVFKDLNNSIKTKSSIQIVEACQQILNMLTRQEHLYHVTRHIVESMRRIAFLIPLHEEASRELKMNPPNFYSHLLIKSHQILLGPAKTFDEEVAFINNSGVPFLWQDLPHIRIDNINY